MKTGYSAGSKNRSMLLCSSKKDLLWSQVTDLSFLSIMELSGRAVLYFMVNLPVVRKIADMSYEHTQDSLEPWNVCLRSLMINPPFTEGSRSHTADSASFLRLLLPAEASTEYSTVVRFTED